MANSLLEWEIIQLNYISSYMLMFLGSDNKLAYELTLRSHDSTVV